MKNIEYFNKNDINIQDALGIFQRSDCPPETSFWAWLDYEHVSVPAKFSDGDIIASSPDHEVFIVCGLTPSEAEYALYPATKWISRKDEDLREFTRGMRDTIEKNWRKIGAVVMEQ